MHYLNGSKKVGPKKLMATFGSEQQLLAYVRWAMFQVYGNRCGKFEQGSALASCESWSHATEPLTDDDENATLHNPQGAQLQLRSQE